MPWMKSPGSFPDVQAAFERAIESNRGIRIKCDTWSAAVQLRVRFNYYRKLNRLENKDIYRPGDKMYGASVYDTLSLRVPRKGAPDENYLYIEARTVENMQIEELPEEGQVPSPSINKST